MPLSTHQIEKANRYNIEAAARVGWSGSYPQVAGALRLGARNPSPTDFSAAVGGWQGAHPPLTPDGKLGPDTWRRMQHERAAAAPGATLPDWLAPGSSASEPAARLGTGPAWLQVAQSEEQIWAHEQRAAAESHTTRDEEYFHASPYFGGRVKARGVIPRNRERRDWCAAFVNWCLHNAGQSHTGSAGAHSFVVPRLWDFTALTEPRPGCVVVVSEGQRGEHVGFLLRSRNLPADPGGNVPVRGHRGRRLEMLGGNQSQRVCVKNERRTMLACRDRNGNRSPYLWPGRGAANCNHLPPSDAGHFCGRVHGAA